MFRCYSYTITRGALNCAYLSYSLKCSIKIYRSVVNMVVVWLHILQT